MTKKRSSRADIYKEVIRVLKGREYNIYQIKEALQHQISWDAIKNALDVMKELKLAKENNNKYSISICASEGNPNTIMGIPLTNQQEQKFCEIANRIKQFEPNIKRTFLQKAVIEVIKLAKINDLPHAWYLYGECSLHKLEDNILKNFGVTTKFDSKIKIVLKKFSEYETTDELLEDLYTKANNDLYLHRLTILNYLRKPFAAENVSLLRREFNLCLLSLIKYKLSEETEEQFKRFLSSFNMLRKLPQNELEQLRPEIIATFDLVWQLIGIDNFKEVQHFYSENLDSYFRERKKSVEETLYLNLIKLKDYWPEPKYNPEIQKLKEKFTKTQEV
ncbi:MAG: hypothetical protein ACLFPQ_02240 [Candidatus Woesearchaeota archaeon]